MNKIVYQINQNKIIKDISNQLKNRINRKMIQQKNNNDQIKYNIKLLIRSISNWFKIKKIFKNKKMNNYNKLNLNQI